MAGTRVNGGVGIASGGIYSPSVSTAFYIITVKDGSNSAVDLHSEVNAPYHALEAIVQTVPSILAYDIVNANTGIIHVITDGANAWSAALLQTAIRALGATVGTEGVDVTGTTVAAGAGFVVSASAV
jgi:hypothetical protein